MLHINGEAVPREEVGTFDKARSDGFTLQIPIFRETLPNGVTYDTLDEDYNSGTDNTRVYEVPPGHYFMMGDNRDNSDDSRLSVGFVPLENFVGKAQVVFFSIDNGSNPLAFWNWPSDLRASRIFKGL